MKVVFMGTPDFAVPSLAALHQHDNIDVVAVVTQPDRINRRGKVKAYSPIKKYALEHGLLLHQFAGLKSEDAYSLLERLNADVFIVVAYGNILPSNILNLPRYGCLNVHASLLPEYRGAAPIQRSILDGKLITGVTIMKLDSGMDTGDILYKQKVKYDQYTDTEELTKILANEGADSLIKVLEDLPEYLEHATPQDHTKATYADKIEKSLGRIDWTEPAEELHRLVCALHANPGTFTMFRNKRLKIHETDYKNDVTTGRPGEIIMLLNDAIAVATGKGILLIKHLQPESKNIMPAEDFINGYQVKMGEYLEE